MGWGSWICAGAPRRLGGALVEGRDVLWGAAFPGMRARGGAEAEVVGDLGDDVLHRAVEEVVDAVKAIQAAEQFGFQGVGFVVVFGFTLDGVLDGAA